MISNFFKTAWRNIRGNLFYSLLNIAGLSIGLAAAVLLFLWVQHERSYDRFYPDYKNIYRMTAHFTINGEDVAWDGVPAPLAVYAKSISPVRSFVRINSNEGQKLSDVNQQKQLAGLKTAFVDSNYLTFFDLPLLQGDEISALKDPHAVILTQSLAEKLYDGSAAAMGQVLLYYNKQFKVTSVIPDYPENSSIRFDALFPMAVYAQDFADNGGNGQWKTMDEDLGNYSFLAYAKLEPGTDATKAAAVFSERYKTARAGEEAGETRFELQPLSDMHLVGIDGNRSAVHMLGVFMLIAVLILVIASINYVNLSTARAMSRAREVSIRKVIGAGKGPLFFQFVVETILLFFVALLLAAALVFLVRPLFNSITGKELSYSWLNAGIWKMIGLSLFGTLLAVSIYPAIVLSGFKPLSYLKGRQATTHKNPVFRKVLVVFQFTISVALIAVTMVVGKQLKFMRERNLGYDRSYVFTVPLPDEAIDHAEAIKNELRAQTVIVNASVTGVDNLIEFRSATSDLEWPGKPEGQQMIITQAPIDAQFIPTMKMKLLEGSNFTGTKGEDTKYILNETAVQKMGLAKPWVGKKISFHSREGTIIGVVKDFNYVSMKEKVAPLIFFTQWWQTNMLYVRTKAGSAQQAIAATETAIKNYAGPQPFSYTFLDKQFESLYQSDLKTGILFKLFAFIAIFISCLGLLGLATYSAKLRVREIGVRKVLGASTAGLVRLLARDFLWLVALAILIAIPLAWWGIEKWMEEFAYREQLGIGIFIGAAMAALLIALLTISFQAIRAAIANPVKSLRTE